MACTKYTFNITNGDLGNAVNNTPPFVNGAVYIDFTDCNSNSTTVNYYAAGSYDICLEDTTTPVMYYYNNNVYTPVSTSSFTPTLVPCSPNYVQCCYPNGPIYESSSNTPAPVGEGVWFDGDYCYSATTNGPAYFTVDDTGFWLFIPDGCSDPQCPECCSCVEVNLSNLDLTQGGQDLWLAGNECGSQVENSQIWSAYPYVMTPSGPTVYMCLQNPAQLKYKYGIAGTVIIGLPPNSNFTVGGTCTTVNDCYTPPPPTTTPTQTPTQTNLPCTCICVDSNLPFLATGNTNPSFDNVVEINYTDCSGNSQAYYQTLVYNPNFCFCTQNGVIDSVLFYQDDVLYFSAPFVNPWIPIPATPNYSIGYFNNGICYGNPCGPNVSQTPTQTPTPTITPTNTITPTVTSTNTPTPSTTPIVCGSGTTTGSHIYYDCCGNLIQGTAAGLIVSIDYTKPFNGVTKLNVPATTTCVTPTPTSTPTTTPTLTPTPTITPTITFTPTPSKTPKVTPSNSPYVKLKNECDVVTLFDMGIQCYPLAIPTSATSSDGILSIQVTGGTAPYSYYWAGGQRTQTLVGVPKGNYEVTVVDYYGDYTATTICGLFEPSPTPTSTMTPTPTNTPAPIYPSLCLVYVSSNVSYGPIQFTLNGTINGKPTWTSTYSQTQLDVIWSTQNSRWEVDGWTFTSAIPVSVNTSNVPDSGWYMAGPGQPATVQMTTGACPPYLPLMSIPSVQNQTCPLSNNGSITLMTNYGVPPYQYSIDNGITFQSSNVFQGLGSSTYTIITKDSASPVNNVLNNTATIISLGQPASYTIGVVVDNVINVGPGTEIASWHVQVTPPLPVGTTISFALGVNSIQAYYEPGNGTINGTTVVKKNNTTQTASTQLSTPLVSGPRAGCSPYTSGTTTYSEFYNLTITSGDVISGTSTSTLLITNGQVAPNGCVTRLEQSILVNTFAPTINGGVCNSVTNNAQGQGITYHTISNTVQTQVVGMDVVYYKGNSLAYSVGSINKQGYGNIFAYGSGATVGTTSTSINVNTGDVLVFDFTVLPSPSSYPLHNSLEFNLIRNSVNVYNQNISTPAIGSQTNQVFYTYTVPAGTTTLYIEINGTLVP